MTRFLIACLSLVSLAGSAQAAKWNVSQSRMNADTAWVSVSLDVPVVSCNPMLGCGGTQSALLRVTPCPPGVTCVGGEYQHMLTADILRTSIELVLLRGTTYTFQGSFAITRLQFDPIYVQTCSLMLCQQGEVLAPVTFPDTTPVEPASWGRIKSVYE